MALCFMYSKYREGINLSDYQQIISNLQAQHQQELNIISDSIIKMQAKIALQDVLLKYQKAE